MEGAYKTFSFQRRPRMAISLAEVVGRFKADVGRALSAEVIEGVCRDLGHAFRRRLLDPVVLIHSFLLQILHGNVACSALPHLTGRLFSSAAYVRARARLPLALFWELLRPRSAVLSHGPDANSLRRRH